MTRRHGLLLVMAGCLMFGVASTAQAGGSARDWYEGVRVRVAAGQEVLDVTAENRMDAGVTSSNIHVVAANAQGTVFNSPSIPLSGPPDDEIRLNKNLVRGNIDTTVSLRDLQTGVVHQVDIHVETLAVPPTHPYVPGTPSLEGHRMADVLRGYVLLDGELWFDLGAAADVTVWHFSTVTPPSERLPG